MRNSTSLLTVWLFVCLTLMPALGSGRTQVVHMEPYHGPDVTDVTHFGNCQWLYPLDEPNEALISEPDYGSKQRVYYTAHYGDASDNTYTFVLDEDGGTGTGFDVLYVDLNNDNALDGKKERFAVSLSGRSSREKRPVSIVLQVRSGGKVIRYGFEFTMFGYKDDNHPVEKIHANCRDSTIFVGRAEFNGKACKIAIADLDSNGLFNDFEMGIFNGDRLFVDVDGDGEFKSGYASDEGAENFPYARYNKIAGNWYTVTASPDGGSLSICPAQPTFGKLKAAGTVSKVQLARSDQFQTISLDNGLGTALTGDYEVYSIEFSKKDDQSRAWQVFGRFRRDKARPKVTIGPEQTATLPALFPLTVTVVPKANSGAAEVELTPTILSRQGNVFGIPYVTRNRPKGEFAIQDEKGKAVYSGDFEYG